MSLISNSEMEAKFISDLLSSSVSDILTMKQRIEITGQVIMPNGEVRRGMFITDGTKNIQLQTEFTGLNGIEKTIESMRQELKGMNL